MKISSGTAHKLPADLQKALIGSPKARAAWEDITPLARNEWICWTISVKTPETRKDHVRRVVLELIDGVPVPIRLFLIFRTDLKGEGFTLREYRAAIKADARNAADRELHGQYVTFL